jgi:hypothetical protein
MSSDGPTDDRIAFCIARAMVRVAGAIHSPRAVEWEADLAFLQGPGAGEAGLAEAWSHLASAPRLSCRAAVLRALRSEAAGGASLPKPLPPRALDTRRHLRPDFSDWVRGLTEPASTPARIAGVAYTVGNCFAGDPFHVTFVRELDGSLRGLEVTGAEEYAVAVTLDCLARLQDRLEASGQSVTVLRHDELAALLTLAEQAAPYFPAAPDEQDEVVASIAYCSGSPLFLHGGEG